MYMLTLGEAPPSHIAAYGSSRLAGTRKAPRAARDPRASGCGGTGAQHEVAKRAAAGRGGADLTAAQRWTGSMKRPSVKALLMACRTNENIGGWTSSKANLPRCGRCQYPVRRTGVAPIKARVGRVLVVCGDGVRVVTLPCLRSAASRSCSWMTPCSWPA